MLKTTMSDEQIQQVKGIYGEIIGWLDGLPPERLHNGFPAAITTDVVHSYNQEVFRLSAITLVDYNSHFLINSNDQMYGTGRLYLVTNIKLKMGSLAKRLEQEYGVAQRADSTPPLVISVNQNQQVQVSITPIQQIIDSTDNEELRKELEKLRKAVEVNKKTEETSKILKKIINMSWPVFIKVLPYILEHMDKMPKQR